MRLLTKELLRKLPPLYATEEQPSREKMAIVKLFLPGTYWTWYIVEYDGNDTCFGLVCGHDREFGYFSLAELQAVGWGRGTLPIERDISFKPTPIAEIMATEA